MMAALQEGFHLLLVILQRSVSDLTPGGAFKAACRLPLRALYPKLCSEKEGKPYLLHSGCNTPRPLMNLEFVEGGGCSRP